MKIIISPTKTQVIKRSQYLSDKELLFPHKHAILVRKLQSFSKKKCRTIFNISEDLFEQVYFNIKNYEELDTFHAFEGYDGLVFKGLDKASYKELEYQYIESHLYVLDAFYGLLEPGTLIRNYRLDFKMNIGKNLYDFWDVSSHLEKEVVINLASSEYAKMMRGISMVTIHFLQEKNLQLKNVATYSKQARGLFLNYLIQNQITDIEKMKHYSNDGYTYNCNASDKENIVFSRIA